MLSNTHSPKDLRSKVLTKNNEYLKKISNDTNDSSEFTELVTEEIIENKNMEYIPHSSKDTTWLQKKWGFIIGTLGVNIAFIFLVIFTKASAYLMIPFITLSHVKDVIFVVISIVARVFRIEKKNWGKKVPLIKGSSLKMASIVTCYTEKYETVLETCVSLFASAEKTKEYIDINVKNVVICVCDGRLVGQENSEPLGDSFRKLMTPTQKPIFRKYVTWKNQTAIAMINIGYLHDPSRIFILIVKSKNHGKKDGLILAKKVISDINSSKDKYSSHPDLTYNESDKTLDNTDNTSNNPLIKYTFCCDADTAIDVNAIPICIKNMESYPELDASVCLLRVMFHKKSFFWDPMQHFQYFNSQFVRRGTESFFGKVTCLSGSGNMCRVSSSAYKYANYHYEKYPKTTSMMDVVPKMIGTDRRYTTLMLKESKKTKLAMLPKSYVYTETPQDFLTYISQRKRWGTNSFSNSLVNIASRNFPWYLKISALVDLFRILSSYFRIVSYIWFWVYIYQVELASVYFVLATIAIVYLYAFTIIAVYGDKRLVLLYGFVLNKLTSPIFTALIFTEILFRFDDFNWGMTQKIKSDQEDLTNLFGPDVNAKFGKKKSYTHNVNNTDYYIDDVSDSQLSEIVIDGGDGKENGKKNQLKSLGKPYRNLRKTKGLKWIDKRFYDDREELSSEIPEACINNYNNNFIDADVLLSESDMSMSDTSEVGWDTNSNNETGTPMIEIEGENGTILIPPPPPPPPGPGSDLLVKTKDGPKTKRLHWKSVNRHNAKATFWENSGYIHFSLNEDEMFELFQETKNLLTQNTKDDPKNAGLVEFHKMHLTGVIFKKFKWKVKDIVTDIVNCKLDDDAIAALMTVFPLGINELKTLENYDKKTNKKKLSTPERFFLSIYRNVNVNTRERLECCAFKNNLSVLLTDIRRHTSVIRKACSSIKKSKKFASILRIIYKLGSILNKDSYLENAAGFTLDVLPNMKDTKTKNGENLLEYLIKSIMKQKPKLLNFSREIKYVSSASKISLGAINQLWDFIDTNMALTRSEVKRTTSDNANNDIEKRNNSIFSTIFTEFLNNAEELVNIENKFMKMCFREFKDTLLFYGEDREKIDTITTEIFFGNIVKFMDDFDNVVKKHKKKKNSKSNTQLVTK